MITNYLSNYFEFSLAEFLLKFPAITNDIVSTGLDVSDPCYYVRLYPDKSFIEIGYKDDFSEVV